MSPSDTSLQVTRAEWADTAQSAGSAPAGKPLLSQRSPGVLSRILRSVDLRRVLPGLLLSSFLANILALALPIAILLLLDKIIVNQAYETLIVLLFCVVLALFLEEILRLLNSRITSWLGARFEHDQTSSALAHMLRVPLRLLRQEEPGVHVSRLLSTNQVAEFYSGQALLVLFDLPFIALFLGLIWFIGGPLALVPVVLLLVFTLIALVIGRRMRAQTHRRAVQDDRRHNFLNETLRGFLSVKLLGLERLMRRRYERLQERSVENGAELASSSAMASSMGQIFTRIMIVAVISAGAFSVISGAMTPGALAACMMLSVRSLQPLRRGLSVWLRYQSFTEAHQRLDALWTLPTDTASTDKPLPPVRSSIVLKDVGLARDHKKTSYLLRNVQLRIPAGSCIAITGESGSGKSSLLALLNGLYRPDEGQVFVDEQPLDVFAPDSIPREIALLPQHGSLFAGTLMENMTLFDAERNEDALRLAERLGLDAMVAGMRLGYDTPVGDGVNQPLPSGVVQRVCLVRALLDNPSVVLFDEANINLDPEGDRHLREYLQEEKGRRTIVMITHRPSLLSLADQVLALHDGKLTENLSTPPPTIDNENGACVGVTAERLTGPDQAFLDLSPYFETPSDLSRCLQPLLQAVGWRGEDQELCEALPHMAPSLDINGFRTVLANLGFHDLRVSARLNEIDDRLTPCLFLARNNPARVILERRDDGKLRIFDGDLNTEALLAPSRLKGEVLCFRPREASLAEEIRDNGLIRALAGRFKQHLALTMTVSLLSTLLTLASPLFVMTVYNRILPTGDVRLGAMLLAGVLIAMILNWFLMRFKSRLIAFMAGRAEYLIGNVVFQRILELPLSGTQSSSASRQLMRLKSFENLREFFLGPLATLLFEPPGIILLLVVVGLLNPWALPVLGVSGLLFLLLGFLARSPQKRRVQDASNESGRRWEFLMEAMANTRALRSTGVLPLWLRRFRDISGNTASATFRNHWLNAKITAAARFLGMATGVAVLGVSVVGVIQGWMTSGSLIATLIIVWRLVGPLQNLLMAIGTWTRVSTTIRQLEALLRLPVEEQTPRRTKRPKTSGMVQFARVSFRYTNDADPALLGVTFSVAPGRMAAITGPNGSGKSTLLKLLTRAYTPQAGAIRLDNVDLRQIPVTDLRSRISYMPQNCELFFGSIEQNLRLTHPVATAAELCWAMDMAGLTKDVDAFPDGLKTRISDNSAELLPNGFRQRLSLARTILKSAPVILLDEPERGMDKQGDLALIRCLEYLKRNATVIFVSHRPSHMRLADAVIYLEGGSIKKIGPYDQINEIITAEQNK
ncbi:peptidase domain-containing ABC transporter [Desulfonatronum thioautotrophicum]|uniref:peptidase domain-containing ABC transporter n=1 Tax=Desulfonatronum thioautotrophicum TaxID=617001 RepID=UPI0005EB714F|nr:ATP-binding cassette domain-containing protein [Desulfonatronum thioautotrophicum]